MKNLRQTSLLIDVHRLSASLKAMPEPVEMPVFITLSGLPGTGKSYFSRRLAKKLSVVILESDALRKTLFPEPTYSWQESARLFRAIYYLLEALLKKGFSVLLDATNLSEKNREKLYNIAKRVKVKFILVKLEAPPELVGERLKARAAGIFNFSDADWTVYEAMRSRAQPIRHRHFVVDSSKNINPIINKIVREARKERILDGD